MEGATSRWSACSIAKGARNVEDDVGRALTSVFGETADASKRFISPCWR